MGAVRKTSTKLDKVGLLGNQMDVGSYNSPAGLTAIEKPYNKGNITISQTIIFKSNRNPIQKRLQNNSFSLKALLLMDYCSFRRNLNITMVNNMTIMNKITDSAEANP